ncbi:MAG: hypothetical protein ACR2JI_06830 [Mycobacterium sp.]
MSTSSLGRSRAQSAALAAVFAMVIGFTYSDDVVEFFLDITGAQLAGWRWIVVAIDVALLAGSAFLKWRIAVQAQPALSRGRFWHRLVRSWWTVGAVLILSLHLVVIGLAGTGSEVPLGMNLLVSLLFVTAMGLVLASTLDTEMAPGIGWSRHGWVLPLVVGTLVVQVASALWFPVIDINAGCANEVSDVFFSQIVQVLPVLLITLGIEMGFLRRRASVLRPADRAAPVLTVLLLCAAEGLAFSMTVKTDGGHCGVAAVWHEYIAFVVSVQALAIGLATLAWLLVADSTSNELD